MQKCLLILVIVSFFFPHVSVFEEVNENTVSATVTAKVTTIEEHSPIRNARIIVINSAGAISGTALTNSEGEAKIPVTVHKDPRFPTKNIGEVTVIAVADGEITAPAPTPKRSPTIRVITITVKPIPIPSISKTEK